LQSRRKFEETMEMPSMAKSNKRREKVTKNKITTKGERLHIAKQESIKIIE